MRGDCESGGLPRYRVRGWVQLRGRAGVGAQMAHSGQYLAKTVFFRRSLPAIDISISDLHNGGVLNAHDVCFLQQSDLNKFRILQTLTELRDVIRLDDVDEAGGGLYSVMSRSRFRLVYRQAMYSRQCA